MSSCTVRAHEHARAHSGALCPGCLLTDSPTAAAAREHVAVSEDVLASEMDVHEDSSMLSHPCRCGGTFEARLARAACAASCCGLIVVRALQVSEEEANSGAECIVPCSSCSLFVRVVWDDR